MSPRRNWGSPNPSITSECSPPPRTGGGGGHTRLRVRDWGSPNSDDWRKSLALFLLCGIGYLCTCDLYYPVRYVILLMRADALRGQVGGGWALVIKTCLGPVKWHRAVRRVPLGQCSKLKSQNLLEINRKL
jgi:hypothetical protein